MEQKKLIDIFFKELDKLKIEYWLCWGSVLGAVRNKGNIISHDHDIDIGIWENDISVLKELSSNLKEHNIDSNFQKDMLFFEDLVQFRNNKIKSKFHIDIYVFRKKENKIFCRNTHSPSNKFSDFMTRIIKGVNRKIPNSFIKYILIYILNFIYLRFGKTYSFVIPSHFYEKFKKIDFLKRKINVPSRYINYIEFCYGKNWMKPNKDWITIRDSGFVKIYKLSFFENYVNLRLKNIL